MPPPDSNKRRLSAAEQQLIRDWIAAGAPYEPHWSFVPPTRPAEPTVADASWCNNAIDRFILSRLEHEHVAPSPPADREALARRIYLDVTGLPPTPEEIDAFVNDAHDDAVARLVDRLLTTEPYRSRQAEHQAARWLDQARYADTNGIHTDAGRQMWPWRDWVLRAMRDNMPFDQFLREQLAGDLIPDATIDQRIASGFNRNHVMTDEGGAIPEEYLVEYAVDRTATVGSVFLGLTLGCARCHEHKFDPISQEEFYGLYAFFNSLEEPGLYSQLPDPNRAFEPFLAVPTDEQRLKLQALDNALADARTALEQPDPREQAQQAALIRELGDSLGWHSIKTTLVAAESDSGASLSVTPEGTVLASGLNPDTDEHTITLRTDGVGVNLVALEALPHPTLPEGRVGRAPNGNAVLTHVSAEAISVSDPTQRTPITFRWAWANDEQTNGDYAVVNVLDSSDRSGWAVAGHLRGGHRVALLLADQPFGFDGGTEVVIRLAYRSVYPKHTLGHVRLHLGRAGDTEIARLPPSLSGWYKVGPFETSEGSLFDASFGPESLATIDFQQNFGAGNQYWRHDEKLLDATLNSLAEGVNVSYVGRRAFAASPRTMRVSLGSDDGFQLFVNGQSVAREDVSRSLAADQNEVQIDLAPGANTIVLKIVNTGGVAGFYFRGIPADAELTGALLLAALPEIARTHAMNRELDEAWRVRYSPGYRERQARIAELEAERTALNAHVPLTMIMQELPVPRPTYVLERGVYDKPDMDRPIERSVPELLGPWPADAPRNRLGLAQWMLQPENPLVARVAMNRLWEQFFGTGLVATSEDFGMQGQWPSHPDLLDWLAVEFRESGWDVQYMIRLIVTSRTYQQASRVRPELAHRDPENRWLAYYPRRRMTAEQVRDQALFVSGLLVEKLGGPSVKPYQPDGLWKEVSMLASNTREYRRGEGPDLWRRSLYTYWKRACPPPSLMAFDAPTRESCTIQRSSTNTPMQALVLWNDPQFVEAARELARRTIEESADDDQRIVGLFRRVTGRAPEASEVAELTTTLTGFREHFGAAPDDARQLLTIGAKPPPAELAPEELAAWSMLASAVLNLSEAIAID
jgi:hypothetical protein